ncbi:MAG: hypothetical protein J7J93_01205 [Candidatus Aenigmarchaeota archaeon]|nr:hypothetical protein [Candidatus Aenigmarchaeota archaeon]
MNITVQKKKVIVKNINLTPSQKKIIKKLIKSGLYKLKGKKKTIVYTKNPKWNNLLNNIDRYPHLFLLANIMNIQMKAEYADKIPCIIADNIGGPEFKNFLNVSKTQYIKMFNKLKLHRFNNKMSERFYLAVQKIHTDYNNHASNICENSTKEYHNCQL